MKLIQLNIWQGRILRHVTHFLEKEQPDIVCLQEVYSTPDPVRWWDSFSALEAMQRSLPYMQWFFAPLYSFEVQGRKVTAGNAIGSRFPISQQKVMFTTGHFTDVNEDPISNVRNVQTCQLELKDGKTLSVANHHAYWDKNPAGTPDSVRCMQQVKEAVDQLPVPKVLCGDMNVRPESETMQLFKGSLANLTEIHKLTTTLTQVGAAFDRDNIVPCDHVLISPEISVQKFYASEKIISDHKALVLLFDVK